MERLEGIRVAILATNGYEQVELTSPRQALEEAGAETAVVSPESGSITGWDHTDWGDDVDVDVTLDEAREEDFDALLLPGGVLNPDKLRMDDRAVRFVRSFFDAGKPVAAICHGPQTMIDAEVVEGRRMTSYPAIRWDLINAGADWVDQSVVVDDGLITSRKPDDLPAFNEAVVNEFSLIRSAASA